MPRQDNSYAGVVTPILNLLHAHPGTFFTEEEICQQIDCTAMQAHIALDVLVRARLARKEPSASGSDQYTWGET